MDLLQNCHSHVGHAVGWQVEVVSCGSFSLLISHISSVLVHSDRQSFLGLAHILIRTLITGEAVHQVVRLAVHLTFYLMDVITALCSHFAARLDVGAGVTVIWAFLHSWGSSSRPNICWGDFCSNEGFF